MVRRFLPALVEFCRRYAVYVLLAAFFISAGSAWLTATRLGVDTDTSKLISPSLDWQKQSRNFDAAFPQNASTTTIVIDGLSGDMVQLGTARLAEALAKNTAVFKSVRTPDSGMFFNRYGLLFLSTGELTTLSNQLATAQPLLGPLSQDPSLRGLFGVLDKALSGVESGETTPDAFKRPLNAIAAATRSVVEGKPQYLDWGRLMTGEAPRPEELRHFIQVQPRLDYKVVQPGEFASKTIRETAKSLGFNKLGLRVRLTGGIPLEDDELASVSEGAGFATTLSFVAVVVILFLGLRAPRLILSIVLTLIVGLLVTAAFAVLAVGELNLISIAFAVLFIGIGVDFGIQFAMRYRAELFAVASEESGKIAQEDWAKTNAEALLRTARTVTAPLGIAALATCVGFFSFLPTDYRGVSELGLIAGTSMLIALVANVTVLPALLTIWPAHGKPESAGFAWAGPIDRWLHARAKPIVIIASLLGLLAAATIPLVRFDADPLDMRDPKVESVATALELTRDPLTTPYTIDILTPNQKAAEQLADRLSKLPEVKHVLTLASLVPENQASKLAILDDTKLLLGPVLDGAAQLPPPTPQQSRDAVTQFDQHLHAILAGPKGAGFGDAGRNLAKALDDFLAMPGGGDLNTLTQIILSGFEVRMGVLRDAMQATAVTLDTMPKEIREDWISADGRARVSVAPVANLHNPTALRNFVEAIRRVAPEATGSPVTILESGSTVSRAFVTASLLAILAITIVLAIILRRMIDVLLVLLPLLLAGLYSLGTNAVLHYPFNYANVIAVPLLLGIGVAFDIYFVMAWRQRGGSQTATSPELLQSATARAVVFSALTTSSAFGSLVLSHHVGMASMGRLLLMTLGYVLLCTLIVQPALMTIFSSRTARN